LKPNFSEQRKSNLVQYFSWILIFKKEKEKKIPNNFLEQLLFLLTIKGLIKIISIFLKIRCYA